MTHITPVTRARALADARGVKTAAGTLRGILRTLRGTHSSPPPPAPPARASRQISAANLLGRDWSDWQARARTRTLPAAEPVRRAIHAAIAGRADQTIGAVPGAYRGEALASASAAVRHGRAVRLCWGRYSMPHRPHGRGYSIVTADSARTWVDAHDLMRAVRLPSGWRWHADRHGPYISGLGVTDYHPSGDEIVRAVQSGTWSAVIAAAHALAATRAKIAAQERDRMRAHRWQAPARRDRRARLLARLAATLPVTRADAAAAGNCPAGISSWLARVGHPDADSLPLGDVVRLATETQEPRAIASALAAARAARATHRATVTAGA